MPKTLTSAAALATLAAAAIPANAVTTTLSFGWEDGTSTILPASFQDPSAENVDAGTVIDYGPSDAPFDPPTMTAITAPEGSRFLQVTDPDAGGTDPNANLAFVDNLSVGDTVTFSFLGFDPSDGRSPSILANANYFEGNDPGSFGGFAADAPSFIAGEGFLDVSYTVTFGEGSGFDENDTGFVLIADLFTPTLAETASGGPGSYDFFLDDLEITVDTASPTATVTLPDGSVTLVGVAVPEPIGLAVIGLAGLGLLRRRRA